MGQTEERRHNKPGKIEYGWAGVRRMQLSSRHQCQHVFSSAVSHVTVRSPVHHLSLSSIIYTSNLTYHTTRDGKNRHMACERKPQADH